MWQRISGVVDFRAHPQSSDIGQLICTLATCNVDLPLSLSPHNLTMRMHNQSGLSARVSHELQIQSPGTQKKNLFPN